MTVLVTGGAGYIGSHMVLALVDAGEEVVVADNLSTGFSWAIAPQARLAKGDIGDEQFLSQLMAETKFDAVIHFAGSIVVPDSVSDPLGYYHNNTVKSRTLMECAVKAGIRNFIFSSTAAVYGNPETQPVFETALPKPISPYGTSKLMTEWMLRDSHAAYGLNYVALRYFNVAGADPKGRSGQSTPRATHLIKVACQTALGQRPQMDVFGTDYGTPDGTCLRDYIHVSDLIAAHMDALAPPPGRWKQRHLQLRLWARLLGAGSGEGGRASLWSSNRRQAFATPGGRSRGNRRRCDTHPRRAGLAAAL